MFNFQIEEYRQKLLEAQNNFDVCEPGNEGYWFYQIKACEAIIDDYYQSEKQKAECAKLDSSDYAINNRYSFIIGAMSKIFKCGGQK